MAGKSVVPHTKRFIVSYDGIIKEMENESLQKLFEDGRKLLAAEDWNKGKDVFVGALEEAKAFPNDMKTLTTIVKELERYEKYKIDSSVKPASEISWSNVAAREMERLDEFHFDLPQGVFFLDIGHAGFPGHVKLVGKKLLSDLWIKLKIPELFCSYITADMILGLFQDQRLSDSEVTVFYKPLNEEEKLKVMEDLIAAEGLDYELTFPFPLLRESTLKEWGSPPGGWVVPDDYVRLCSGEERIHAYSIKFLKEIGLSKPLLYDPACSTGVFLSTLQKAFPDSYTVGQDVSREMANFAKQRIDEVHCANALDPQIKLGTADVCFIRFLNFEVIQTCEAEQLLTALLPTVKKGGHIITLGHTPVLLSSAQLTSLDDFRLKKCIGVAVDEPGIFQYYVIQRK